jgi:hypothetical protein
VIRMPCWVQRLALLSMVASPLSAQSMPAADRTRIAEAYRIADTFGDRMWSGWSSAPFALLLVTEDREFLIRHPKPDATFKRAGYDSLLHSEVFVRPRVFAPDLLATFPIGPGVPTIVMGQPDATKRTSAQWVITALHEHFHQWQMSSPGYFAAVDSLNLSNGDKTGMWMINFPFPYQSPPVDAATAEMALDLKGLLEASNPDTLSAWLSRYYSAQQSLRELLSDEEYRYFAFQLWQEGVARYTEYRLAQLVAEGYQPSPEIQALPDYVPLEHVVQSLRDDIYSGIGQPDLAANGRVDLYPLGAATALVLDRVAPDWKSEYLRRRFDLQRYFP